MTNNEIRIKGRIYRYTIFHTKNDKIITTFGLQYYNGKDKDGKSKYSFVNCKGFNDYQLTEKQDVVVLGHLGSEEWTDKQDSKRERIIIFVDNIESEQQKEEKQEDGFIEDAVPLWE